MKNLNLKKALVIGSVLLPIWALADGFNFSSYQAQTVNDINTKWNDVTKSYEMGITLKQPEKIAITVVSAGAPFSCDNKLMEIIFNSLGMTSFLQAVPVNHCIKFKDVGKLQEITAHMQDTLVSSYVAEVKPGSKVVLYAGFLA